jgi:hypothetical protein
MKTLTVNGTGVFANKIFATSLKTVGTIRAFFFIKVQELDLDTVALCSSCRVKVERNILKATVGAQSIARLCQNLINFRRNIGAHKRRRKLRFFLFERS